MTSNSIDADSIKNMLQSLASLNEERKNVEKRAAELKDREEKFKRARTADYDDTNPSDILHLNVGGRKMSVLRKTLTQVEGSMLAARFSGRWDNSIEKDENGYFFIDQDFELFEAMVNYLRSRANETPFYTEYSPIFEDYSKRMAFYRMVEYYGMTQGIYPTKLVSVFSSSNENECMETDLGYLKVDAKDFSTFKLVPHGHNRRIRSVTFIVTDAQRAQIGWTYSKFTKYAGIDTNYNENYGIEVGIGDTRNSFAIDLYRFNFLYQGQRDTDSCFELKEEATTVRLENYGSHWFVNGKLVASMDYSQPDLLFEIEPSISWYRSKAANLITPAFSVKGKVRISDIEYED